MLHQERIAFGVDVNLLAPRPNRGYHFARLRYYTSPLPDVNSPAYRRQQKFFDELRRSGRTELCLGATSRGGTGADAAITSRRRRT
jgi:hypothetical protein